MTRPTELPEAIRAHLCAPSLQQMWTTLRARLERTGHAIRGTVRVALDDDAADRVSGLLGRPIPPGDLALKLDDLDAALRASAAARGLAAVVAELTGSPLRDRPAERDAAQAERAGIWHTLDSALVAAGLADRDWIADWSAWLRRSGTLTRLAPSAAAATTGMAVRVLSEVIDRRFENDAQRLRGELAMLCTGSAHGLDDGTPVSAIVLRAVALSHDMAIPLTAADRRATWLAAGVSTDEVSGTVLTWGLRPPGLDRWSGMMRERADLGLVTHLTTHELRDAPSLTPPGLPVYVCENPQVLQTLATAGVGHSVVCVSGNPAAAGSLLLARVRARYHGDFDWPGVSIARRIIAAGAEPWQYGAGDYLAAVERIPSEVHQPLAGRVDETPWDAALRQAMARVGVAVHEEAVLDTLLNDLL